MPCRSTPPRHHAVPSGSPQSRANAERPGALGPARAPADTPPCPRRWYLPRLGATGAAAVLGGCENKNVANLPDPLNSSLVPDGELTPPIPTHPLPPPVTRNEPANTYGILPRSMWAKAGPDLNRVDPLNGPHLITFHHSGEPKAFTTTDFGETAQHLEYVREYHRSRNFQDIGYHFAIDRAGRVWQLRSLKYQGQHVRYSNEHNIGVVVLGNFDMQALSTAQKDKIKVFGALLRKQYNLP